MIYIDFKAVFYDLNMEHHIPPTKLKISCLFTDSGPFKPKVCKWICASSIWMQISIIHVIMSPTLNQAHIHHDEPKCSPSLSASSLSFLQLFYFVSLFQTARGWRVLRWCAGCVSRPTCCWTRWRASSAAGLGNCCCCCLHCRAPPGTWWSSSS